jgi:hypothetical protein
MALRGLRSEVSILITPIFFRLFVLRRNSVVYEYGTCTSVGLRSSHETLSYVATRSRDTFSKYEGSVLVLSISREQRSGSN